jgi:hypothetical protein
MGELTNTYQLSIPANKHWQELTLTLHRHGISHDYKCKKKINKPTTVVTPGDRNNKERKVGWWVGRKRITMRTERCAANGQYEITAVAPRKQTEV